MAADSSGALAEDEWAWTRAQVSRAQPRCRIARRTVLSRPSRTFARALDVARELLDPFRELNICGVPLAFVEPNPAQVVVELRLDLIPHFIVKLHQVVTQLHDPTFQCHQGVLQLD